MSLPERVYIMATVWTDHVPVFTMLEIVYRVVLTLVVVVGAGVIVYRTDWD